MNRLAGTDRLSGRWIRGRWGRFLKRVAACAAFTIGAAALAVAGPTTAEFDADGQKWTVLIRPQGGESAAPETDIVITPAVRAEEPSPADPFADYAPPPETVEAPESAGETREPDAAPPEVRAARSRPTELASLYSRVYGSIPYIPSEHQVNPAYRHDATMEILTGRPRPAAALARPSADPGAPAGGLAYPLGVLPPGALSPIVSPYIYPYPYPHGFAPYASARGWGRAPFGYFNFSRGPYSLYQRLFGYDGGWRTQFYINGGYGNPYALWW